MLYNDRKMLKWQGFLLSEHNQQLEYLNALNQNPPLRKPRQSLEEITQSLAFSYLEHRLVLIQLNEKEDGNYRSDLEGIVRGFDEECAYLYTLTGIFHFSIGEIRNVVVPNITKWYK